MKKSLFYAGWHAYPRIECKTGDKVKKGQVLAVLDVTSVEKEIRGKRLQIRKAEVQMKETLRKKDEMDPVEFEEATIAFEELRQELADLEEKLGQSTLTAPFGGTVIAVQVEKGHRSKRMIRLQPLRIRPTWLWRRHLRRRIWRNLRLA